MWWAAYRKISFVPTVAEYVASIVAGDQNCGAVPMVSAVAAPATADDDELSGGLTVTATRCPFWQWFGR